MTKPPTQGTPDDLVSIAEAARQLGRNYRSVWTQVKKNGLDRWETGVGDPLVSMREMREFYALRDTIRPRNAPSDPGEEEES